MSNNTTVDITFSFVVKEREKFVDQRISPHWRACAHHSKVERERVAKKKTVNFKNLVVRSSRALYRQKGRSFYLVFFKQYWGKCFGLFDITWRNSLKSAVVGGGDGEFTEKEHGD